ncbi:MAG: NADH-quinone oxidoreductase subunit C [Patescibacteria group bacterium]|nr:NADH-quinone oxidoreductase subunit C [Patescibacteria group bacterium]MDE1966119.1 NADH-quinone oxidoreductase subunit C [Patescibacteria group bacterium]
MTIDSLRSSLRLPALTLFGATVVPSAELPAYADACAAHGAPLVFMYGTDERAAGIGFAVHAVFALPGSGFVTLRSVLPAEKPSYPSLTRTIMAAHWFERLMQDQFGIIAEGHPDPRRLIHHENVPEGTYPLRKDFAWDAKLPHADVPYPMHRVEGRGVYEIPVGPIHAGVIEPGHFRFNVRGERILSLEGKLFFTHKGVEKLVEGKTPAEALPFIERISGDMPVAHTLAFAEAVERASCISVPKRARMLRVVWSELERITMHLFDMGNMGGNGTGFTFMAAQGFRMVEEMRRMHASLAGHRYLRGAVTPGGAHDLSQEAAAGMLRTLARIERDMKDVLKIAYGTDGLMERFETTGVLSRAAALAYGARGIAARASGVDTDARRDYPYAAYDELAVNVVTEKAGDVAARFKVRAREFEESLRLVRAALAALPEGKAQAPAIAKEGAALAAVESWRGTIYDWVRIGADGRIDRAAISDPSFSNWPLFGEIGPGNIVPDFPLCNKSLNLSYSGTDL